MLELITVTCDVAIVRIVAPELGGGRIMLVSITGGGSPPGIPLGMGGMPGGIPGIMPPTGGIPTGGGMPGITIGWGGIMPIGITGIIPAVNIWHVTLASFIIHSSM